MHSLKIGAVTLFLLIISIACGQAPTTSNVSENSPPKNTSTPVTAATPDELAESKALYHKNCAMCHQESGKGGEVVIEGKKLDPDDLTGDKLRKASDEKLIEYITNGVEDEGMPAFGKKLSPAEIKSIVAYVRHDLQAVK